MMVLSSCFTSVAEQQTGALIGPEGGTLSGPDGLQLEAPAGALAQPTRLTITRVSPVTVEGFQSRSTVWKLGPRGQQFAKPIALKLPLSSGAAPEPVVVLTAPEGSSTFEVLPADRVDGFAVTSTTHFSIFLAATPPAGPCDPRSCSDGCCQKGQCVRFGAQGASQCGMYAETCKACPGGCRRGMCQVNSCNSSTCSGCCNIHDCSPGTFPALCGTPMSCGGCRLGEACVNQQCVAIVVHIGDACTTDSQCSPLGLGAYCKQTTSSGNATYPGGFCTLPCYGVPSCPQGANGGTVCAQFAATYGEADVFCAPTCGRASDPPCRAGYSCVDRGGGFKLCWLPAPMTGARVPTGSPCLNDTECASNPGGYCIPEYTATYVATGYAAGYCSVPCSGACTDGTCVTETFSTPLGPAQKSTCKARCTGTGQSTCRIGYNCRPGPNGDWCGPNCAYAGCPAGTNCSFNGDCEVGGSGTGGGPGGGSGSGGGMPGTGGGCSNGGAGGGSANLCPPQCVADLYASCPEVAGTCSSHASDGGVVDGCYASGATFHSTTGSCFDPQASFLRDLTVKKADGGVCYRFRSLKPAGCEGSLLEWLGPTGATVATASMTYFGTCSATCAGVSTVAVSCSAIPYPQAGSGCTEGTCP